ncbi:MAG: hypothetical protein HON53_15145 [Planctomycetaceae bacterium]|jgi:hypothetical protein|nr:hypothetical protein [Planctomycetaceae bacterium]MBT6153760.1 hypothetical protein [Planctomycetaceae bacterium]MBT6495304.1 hypothetical protein [Planctomycetaceae bacterium]
MPEMSSSATFWLLLAVVICGTALLIYAIKSKQYKKIRFGIFKGWFTGEMDSGEGPPIDTNTDPDNQPDALLDSSLESFRPIQLRMALDWLQKMDREISVLISTDQFRDLNDQSVAVMLFSRVARHAHELFDKVLWPNHQVFTSLKTLSPPAQDGEEPEGEEQLLCYYPDKVDGPERRSPIGSNGPRPEQIPKKETFSGWAFDKGEVLFVPNAEERAKDWKWSTAIINEFKIGSLVVCPIFLNVPGQPREVVAVLKVDCHTPEIIEKTELAELLISSVVRKIELIFHMSPRLQRQIAELDDFQPPGVIDEDAD